MSDAESYDAWFDRPWGAYATAVEHALLLQGLPPLVGLRVCDAGCGTGRFLRRLEDGGAHAVGVDLDAASLAVAARRVRAPLLLGDVHRLPFPGEAFDATFAVTVCEFTSEPAAVIAELARVTRPGGHIVIGSLNRNSPWGWWNRRKLHRAPWNTAHFLDRATLEGLGAAHGTTTWRAGLYPPRALPAMGRWAPPIEHLASRALPRFGAFGVLSVRRPG